MNKEQQVTRPQHFLPASQKFQRLLEIFGGNLHHWISGPNPYGSGGKPDYRTETRFPIEPRNLEEMFFNSALVVGLRFGVETKWCGFDIDAGSALHPANGGSLTALKEAAEDMGLISPVMRRSSHGGGLWMMWELPLRHRTIEVAALMRAIAYRAGVKLKSGQLEAFPNFKAYKNTSDRKEYTQYAAYRLPMQPGTGDMLFDDDLEPVSDGLEPFLAAMDFTASRIDMEEVRRACSLAYGGQMNRLQSWWKREKTARAKWIADMEGAIAIGWTGPGQTNHLLGKIACLGIVRDGLHGPALVDFIVETATALPGYDSWCRHRHEIDARARDWASSAQQFYWFAGNGQKTRRGTYQDMRAAAGSGTKPDKQAAYNAARKDAVLERMQTALEALRGGFYPNVTLLFPAVCQKAKELFGSGFSKETWYKYKSLLPLGEFIAAPVPTPPPATLEETESQSSEQKAPCPLAEIAESRTESESTPVVKSADGARMNETSQAVDIQGGTSIPLYMKVFEPHSPLSLSVRRLLPDLPLCVFTGRYANGTVDRLLQSIRRGEAVEILERSHTSWFGPESEALVYVRPVGSGWSSGIAVSVKELKPSCLPNDNKYLSLDMKPPPAAGV